MSRENVEIVPPRIRGLRSGRPCGRPRLLAPDVEWHSVVAPLVGVGTIRGRKAMLKFWEDLREGPRRLSRQSGGVHRPRQRSGPGSSAVPRGAAQGSDAEVSMRIASVYEIRDGMVAAVRDYSSRDEALGPPGCPSRRCRGRTCNCCASLTRRGIDGTSIPRSPSTTPMWCGPSRRRLGERRSVRLSRTRRGARVLGHLHRALGGREHRDRGNPRRGRFRSRLGGVSRTGT